ncbi:uncharacterized protein LOC143446729 [Clavelina lepadiformis]|uniref:uncharacterized protein LOC143446729 n=1 Tax=Clavelina lepadiformis TaxID=159417 RepID=UPI004042F57B
MPSNEGSSYRNYNYGSQTSREIALDGDNNGAIVLGDDNQGANVSISGENKSKQPKNGSNETKVNGKDKAVSKNTTNGESGNKTNVKNFTNVNLGEQHSRSVNVAGENTGAISLGDNNTGANVNNGSNGQCASKENNIITENREQDINIENLTLINNPSTSSSGSKTDQKPTADEITTTQPKESHWVTNLISKDGKETSKDGELFQIKNEFATPQMKSANHQSDILAEKTKTRHLEVQLERERDSKNFPCKHCGQTVATTEDIICLPSRKALKSSNKREHLSNKKQRLYAQSFIINNNSVDVITFSNATNITVSDEVKLQSNNWFPGYNYKICYCSKCDKMIGWKNILADAKVAQQEFDTFFDFKLAEQSLIADV